MARARVRRPLLALVVLLVALLVGYAVRAATHDGGSPASTPPGSNSASSSSTPLSELPPEAAQTVRLIEAGGPFPYPDSDGVVFHNDEHELPAESDGYYREYTVPTPGSPDRGARRIVTGAAGEYYYTGDHYAHFARMDVDQ